MQRLSADQIRSTVGEARFIRVAGPLRSSRGTLRADLPVSMNEVCTVSTGHGQSLLAEVVGFDDGHAQLLPFTLDHRIPNDARVESLGHAVRVPCGTGLLGRVISGLGQPIDGKGPLHDVRRVESGWHVPDALTRRRIDTPLVTGQRSIDAFLTLGVGQRVGLFAGSGVGKSTLLGEIAKYSTADYNVIALVGERGREVRPFIEDCLGEAGLARSVVVAATSDETPLMRVRAVQTAVTIADQLRASGKNILFFADSLTRLAMAQREIGLALGEPPTARGYTPSVFQLLASTLEQLGNSDRGSITAIVTVLVDGDDMNDPIADCVRAIVDGHIVLTRELAERGHFPAIDVSGSISRTFNEVTSRQHQLDARKVRLAMATFRNNADLIRAGAYEPGTSAEIDNAIRLAPHINAFLQQEMNHHETLDKTQTTLARLSQAWTQSA